MLGDIENGKYGKVAEMLRSDAVAFILQQQRRHQQQQQQHENGNGNVRLGLNKKRSTSSNNNNSRLVITKVETRSILTLKMGFVSMSYGILLQWDCNSKLVELIVLRKMCRDDFMKRDGLEDATISMREIQVSSSAAAGSGSSRQPLLTATKKQMPDLIPIPVTADDEVEVSSSSARKQQPSTTVPDHDHGIIRFALPKLSLPSFFFPWQSNGRPQSFLSVSVLNVKDLHNVCDQCRNTRNSSSSSSGGRMINGAKLTTYSKFNKKSEPTIRPYVRFVLGRHEHCTKITRYNEGNPKWTKRHHNSCVLPCPPEELRWFAGREDLIVEVRNDWKKAGSGSGSGSSNHHHHLPLFGGGGRHDEHTSSNNKDHQILAVVTVPLSSVNIEDAEDDTNTQAATAGRGRNEGTGTWKRRTHKDGASSTNITIPLRMCGCQVAPLGSISLKVTIKVPNSQKKHDEGGGNNNNTALANNKSNNNTRVQISASDGKNGEPSIELGPLTRLMESLGGSSPVKEPASSSNGNNKDRKAAAAAGGGAQNNRKTKPTGGGKKKHKNLKWNTQFDHQTKKWSRMSNNSTQTTTSANPLSSKKVEEGSSATIANGDNGGWFTFLNRESTREVGN